MEIRNNQNDHTQVDSRQASELNVCFQLRALFQRAHPRMLVTDEACICKPAAVYRMLAQIRNKRSVHYDAQSMLYSAGDHTDNSQLQKRTSRRQDLGRQQTKAALWLGQSTPAWTRARGGGTNMMRAVALLAGVGVWCIDPCLSRDRMHRAGHLRIPPERSV